MRHDPVYQLPFSKVYQLLVNKALKKGRSKAEVDEIICWLTGYRETDLEEMQKKPVAYAAFFQNAPGLNENRKRITGAVCGIRLETIEEPLMREIRYLDKLIDELANGKAMDQILRK